jgi:hypothetical protein
MKKFIQKSSLFIIPFLCLYFLNTFLYVQNEGDLIRLGYLYNNPSPKSNLSKQFNLNKQYTLVSEIKLNTKPKFDVLTIGDSFSEQESLGYQNFLAKEDFSVLHMDRFLAGDPIQKIIELINGDFFDSIQTDYVILQSVERSFVQRCQEIDYTKSIYIDSIKNKINKCVKKTPKRNLNYFNNSIIKIPLTNIQYHFSYKPVNSKTYKVTTNKDNLFTNNPNNILFYEGDINSMTFKNDSLKIANSNNTLNKINNLLFKKNIKLIVLISPDKYDLYYPYIKEKASFKKPLFFKYYNNLSKEYSSIDSFEILANFIATNKDVYYYDDTHWSPIGASVIAIEINKTINEIKTRTHNTMYN